MNGWQPDGAKVWLDFVAVTSPPLFFLAVWNRIVIKSATLMHWGRNIRRVSLDEALSQESDIRSEP